MLLVAATLVFLLMRDRPSDLKMLPFGDDGSIACCKARTSADHLHRLHRVEGRISNSRVLGPVRHVLHLRRKH